MSSRENPTYSIVKYFNCVRNIDIGTINPFPLLSVDLVIICPALLQL